MEEELFVSGRNLPHIDPNLEIWGFPIAFYLFLGGLAAGILLFASAAVILDKEDKFPATARWAPLFVPLLLTVGLFALIVDLHHPLYSWQLYMTIRLESPMSWGAWVLLIVTPISYFWAFADLRILFPKLNWKFKFLYQIEELVRKYRKVIAWILIPLCIVLGIYTGILLSAFNARPLWNSTILGPLFLISGLSTAAAAIILLAKSHTESSLLSKIDIVLIIIEIGLVIHLIMGYYAGTEMQVESVNILINGELSVLFFVFFILLGLIVPLVMEVFELLGTKIPVYIPAILVLIGGLIFRILMVEAGQLSRILY